MQRVSICRPRPYKYSDGSQNPVPRCHAFHVTASEPIVGLHGREYRCFVAMLIDDQLSRAVYVEA